MGMNFAEYKNCPYDKRDLVFGLNLVGREDETDPRLKHMPSQCYNLHIPAYGLDFREREVDWDGTPLEDGELKFVTYDPQLGYVPNVDNIRKEIKRYYADLNPLTPVPVYTGEMLTHMANDVEEALRFHCGDNT